jgi:hypothetical protein
MASLEVDEATKLRLEQCHYLVAYLAKLQDESSTQSVTVPVTIRADHDAGLVVDVDGHEIEFAA